MGNKAMNIQCTILKYIRYNFEKVTIMLKDVNK